LATSWSMISTWVLVIIPPRDPISRVFWVPTFGAVIVGLRV
jgi:hypothetical protein